MNTVKLLATVISILFFSGVSSASDSPLANLIGTFQKIASGLPNPNSTVTDNSSESQIGQILETYSSSLVQSYGCDLSIKNAVRDTDNALKSGNLSKALMQSKVSAGIIGGCFVLSKRNPNITKEINDYPLSTWAILLGNQLAIGLSLESKMGVKFTDEAHKTSIENARSLLKFASSKNETGAVEILTVLNKAVDSTLDPAASTQSALEGSVESIVSQYDANRFSFDQKFVDKTITVTGKIRNISGDSKKVYIDMLGTPGKNIDNVRLMDSIYFSITDPTQIQKAANLVVGKTSTIRGVYKKEPYSSGINLVGCEILK